MSAVVVDLRPGRMRTDANEVPAVIAGSVNLLAFSGALARVGLIGRHDADRGLLVIEPLQGAQAKRDEADAKAGMAWYNALTPTERRQWHEVAGSAVPADAWASFQSGASPP